ncbi:MAG: hypothetical protein J5604_05135 [Bacteroidales bacterium]|nr:hypothetical protein [Bacteroidales bacterium]
MNTEFLSGLFRDIILREGELILPFMGSILLEDVPTSFSEDGKVITPPSKKLVFNNYNLSSNDILLNEYAKRREISRFAAKQALYKDLEELRTQAEKEGVLTLEGFGTFRFTDREGYTVDPAPGFVISTDTFGLTAVDLNEDVAEPQPVAEEPVAEPAEEPVEEEITEVPVEETVSEPVVEPVAEKVAEVPAEETIKKEEKKPIKKKRSSASKALITIVVIIVVLLVAAALIYIFRDSLRPILEEILYSDEELRIIHYKL